MLLLFLMNLLTGHNIEKLFVFLKKLKKIAIKKTFAGWFSSLFLLSIFIINYILNQFLLFFAHEITCKIQIEY